MSIDHAEATCLLNEAKQSMRMLFAMTHFASPCSLFLLKWPDALESIIQNDPELFRTDMYWLICEPIKVILEGLAAAASEPPNAPSALDKITTANILEQKLQLIRMCNALVTKLRASGRQVEYLH